MRVVWIMVVLLVLFFASSLAYQAIAQDTGADESKRLRMNIDLNDIVAQSKTRQEHVEVRGESYPGLNLKLATPAEFASGYRPPKFRVDLMKKDYYLYSTYDHELSGTARPHKSGKAVEVTVPLNED